MIDDGFTAPYTLIRHDVVAYKAKFGDEIVIKVDKKRRFFSHTRRLVSEKEGKEEKNLGINIGE